MAQYDVLTDSDLDEVLAKANQKGEYDRDVLDFHNQGVKAIRINLKEGRFAERKAASVKTGFTGAIERQVKAEKLAEDAVQVLVQGDFLYLIRRDLDSQTEQPEDES